MGFAASRARAREVSSQILSELSELSKVVDFMKCFFGGLRMVTEGLQW